MEARSSNCSVLASEGYSGLMIQGPSAQTFSSLACCEDVPSAIFFFCPTRFSCLFYFLSVTTFIFSSFLQKIHRLSRHNIGQTCWSHYAKLNLVPFFKNTVWKNNKAKKKHPFSSFTMQIGFLAWGKLLLNALLLWLITVT